MKSTNKKVVINEEDDEIYIPEWAKPLFDPKNQYCILHGGRGSGKSYAVATVLILLALQKPINVLCGREYQNSIRESVHSLLKLRINELGFSEFFIVLQDSIECTTTGARFTFRGLHHHIDSVRSITNLTHIWIEEGDTLSYDSWEVIVPTLRTENAQIFVTFNPKYKTDCIYRNFVLSREYDDSYVKQVNWRDNPYFPPILEKERRRCQLRNPEMYGHIWEGECLQHSVAQVFKDKWVVEEFEEDPKVFKYYGMDFGYSIDPTAVIRCYIKNDRIYITHEAVKIELDIDDIGKFCDERIPGFKTGRITADSARPETIGFLRKQGYNVVAAKKGKGSLEDGIAFIRSFERVVIHPRCKEVAKEFELYSYKIDSRSNEITTDFVDGCDHTIDALRYALEKLMTRRFADYYSLTKM